MMVTAQANRFGELVGIYATWKDLNDIERSFHARRQSSEDKALFLDRALKELKASSSGQNASIGKFEASVQMVQQR